MSKAYYWVNEIVSDFKNNNIEKVIKHFNAIKEWGGNYYYCDATHTEFISLNDLIKRLKLNIPRNIIEDNIKKYPELLEYFI